MMAWWKIAIIWLFVAGAAAAQSTPGVPFELVRKQVKKDDHTLSEMQRGLFSEGFEMASFEPCDLEERWWLQSFGGDADPFWAEIRRLREVFIADNNIHSTGYVSPLFYVEARGTLSVSYTHLTLPTIYSV